MPKFNVTVEETRIWTYQGVLEADSQEEAEALVEFNWSLLPVVDKEATGCDIVEVKETKESHSFSFRAEPANVKVAPHPGGEEQPHEYFRSVPRAG